MSFTVITKLNCINILYVIIILKMYVRWTLDILRGREAEYLEDMPKKNTFLHVSYRNGKIVKFLIILPFGMEESR